MKHTSTNSVVDSMTKFQKFLVITIFVGNGFTNVTANPEGTWEGAFNRLGAIQTVEISLEKSENGWSGTYNIPELILYREPIRELSVSSDTIEFRLFWGKFTAILHNQQMEITGVNAKWNPQVTIHLKKTTKQPEFTIEQVPFKSGSLTLTGDLLIPRGNPPFPVVIILEGSTTTGRQNWLYRSYADLFAKNGIAAFIFDKRGCGESEGNYKSATFDDLTNDAIAAIQHISKHMNVDPTRISLMGISQGGWIAPKAAMLSELVSSVIMLSGPATSVWEQEIDRVEYSMKAGIYGENDPDVFTEDEIVEAVTHTKLGFEVVEDISRWDEWVESVNKAKSSRYKSYIPLDSTKEDLLGWNNIKYDPASTLKKITIPILALYGENDVLVPPKENIPLLESLIPDTNLLKVMLFPEGGHDLMTGASLVNLEWNWPTGFWRWNRRVPGLADTLINWIYNQR